jgi:uncharacterized short protein YbdD (DUF466 family)
MISEPEHTLISSGHGVSLAIAPRNGHADRAFRRVWSWLRQVTGDAAYENYLRATRRDGRRSRVLSPSEFYLDALRRRYSTHSRCC